MGGAHSQNSLRPAATERDRKCTFLQIRDDPAGHHRRSSYRVSGVKKLSATRRVLALGAVIGPSRTLR